MPSEFDSFRDLKPSSGKQFLIIALIAAQIYIALQYNRSSGSILLENMFVLPVIVSALFLQKREGVFFSIFSAVLYSYSFSIMGTQSTLFIFVSNFLIATCAYAVIGEIFGLLSQK